MSDRFVVEADRQVVGLGVRVPGGFRFFASDPAFASLEAKTFRRARTMARRVAQFARSRRRPRRATAPAPGRPGRR
jgi:hypothetical protein